jgi:hypothetical protein
MLNADLVNARTSYFSPPHFCESFAVSGRISRFRNPFKYTRNFRINQPQSGALLKKSNSNHGLAPQNMRLTNQ